MNLDQIQSPFTKIFPGDFSQNPMQRITPKVLFSTNQPIGFDEPKLIAFNQPLADEIGLGKYSESDLDFLVGNNLPENIETYATAYAGHQFGNWAGQLGDGRAIFAGEIINKNGLKTEIQWKGAGATPYSRHADGRAVLRSSVREYLMSEAMFHLNVPTTRALSLCFTGEDVIRDIMYDGNPRSENGAVVIRTAESFLRFGHFELLASQQEHQTLQQLADFTIENYFKTIPKNSDEKYKLFFEEVCQRTANLMVEWFRVGFVHGVMNTDNMSILGLTIDFGPFSMVDHYDLNFTPNTTDLPGRRYAFGKQGQISQWNLWQLANALQPLINDSEFLEKTLNNFGEYFWQKHDTMLCNKFGFDELLEKDENLFIEWQTMMQDLQLDYTLFFNRLQEWRMKKMIDIFSDCSYLQNFDVNNEILIKFLNNYQSRLEKNAISEQDSLEKMNLNNPKFILRNYLLYQAIEQLEEGNRTLFDELFDALQNPYQEKYSKFSEKRPILYDDISGCSMLSCSS